MQREADPDPHWVSELTGRSIRESEGALDEAEKERRLFSHLDREHRREGRSHYIEIDAPLELFAITRLLRPAHLLEVGVSSGVSSAYLLQALERNGRGTLHSVDRPKLAPANGGRRSTAPSWSLPPGRSSGWAVPDRLRPRWDLRIGDKKVVLPLLADELSEANLLVYDVPHDDRAARQEFGRLDPLFAQGSVLIADHGPGGGMCAALRGWARTRGAVPTGRRGLGLYGFRAGTPPRRRAPSRPAPPRAGTTG
jgi:hypothetical protein